MQACFKMLELYLASSWLYEKKSCPPPPSLPEFVFSIFQKLGRYCLRASEIQS